LKKKEKDYGIVISALFRIPLNAPSVKHVNLQGQPIIKLIIDPKNQKKNKNRKLILMKLLIEGKRKIRKDLRKSFLIFILSFKDII
jgi:hypothetical protein